MFCWFHSKRWWPGVPSTLLVPTSSSRLHSSSSSHSPHSPWSCGSCSRLTCLSPAWRVLETPSVHPASHLAALPGPLTDQSRMLWEMQHLLRVWGYFWRIFAAAECTKQPRNSAEGFAAPGRAGFNCPCSSTSPSTCSRQPKPQKLDAPCEEHNVHLVLAAKTWRMIFRDQGSL